MGTVANICRFGRTGVILAGLMAMASGAGPALSATLDHFEFQTPGASDDLRSAIRSASLVLQARNDKKSDVQDLFAAAQADYGRILGALYAQGHYSGVIHISIDGQEAATIPPLDVPATINSIVITVDPGPAFTFRQARMKPYARGTDLPHDYLDGAPAASTAVVAAADAGVSGWRDLGHAKARVSDRKITADHGANVLDSWVYLDPGPLVHFGQLTIAGYQRMNPRRLAVIADFPTGKVFDPKELDDMLKRLRRTGVFKSVTLTEGDKLGPGNTLSYDLTVVEERKRRLGFGAEVTSLDGLSVTGYWIHRNLWGGAERLKLDFAVSGIATQSGGTDYSLGARIDRPATFSRDTTAFAQVRIDHLDETDHTSDEAVLGLGVSHIFTDTLTGTAEIDYYASDVTDLVRTTQYRLLAFPISLTWDRRDSATDAHKGFYVNAEAKPFVGFGSTGNGARLTADARAYRGFGTDDRIVLAARGQVGTIVGPGLLQTPRDYLFYTGGGGTVRGQPYQSLGVNVLRSGLTAIPTGGLSFAAASAEARVRVTEKIGAVVFADAGYVTSADFFGGISGWQGGAGIGLRYRPRSGRSALMLPVRSAAIPAAASSFILA